MKIYIAGPITNKRNHSSDFKKAEEFLIAKGNVVMNPCCLPFGFDYCDYMKICFSMIDVCDAIYLLDDWRKSKGACMEYEYAMQKNKHILTELF